jgi:hypothetical protein
MPPFRVAGLALACIGVLVSCRADSPSAAAPTPPRAGSVVAANAELLRERTCRRHDAAGRCQVHLVSVYQLVARPELFDGRRVRVIGYAHFEFEGNGLYPTAADYEAGIAPNGVWLDTGDKAGPKDLSDRYVLVEGLFDASGSGHVGMWSGEIGDITQLEGWNRPVAPLPPPAQSASR